MRVLPMFIGLKGQFVDPVENLLLRSGPCCVACFRHGGVVQSLGHNKVKTREEVVAQQLLMVNLS